MDRLKIQYFIAGGVAARYYGVPRMTIDVDIAIQKLEKEVALKLLDVLCKKDRRLKQEKALKILTEGGILRVDWMDVTTVDLIVGWAPDFFRRVKKDRETGLKIISPEDLILSKLESIKKCKLETARWKDAEDIQVLLNTRRLDLKYLRKKAKQLGVSSLLKKFLKKD
ncbi:MAG: nucleotidyl transferase AbiEii/AbiGii toxin family protein [Candidatus Hadarchaeales archaeon]